ncbi:hypothetical protein FQN57_006637 [Myotisia sp. PD_48]|nr:hypothetical protein FQN57_006637 [Myotisia sp. PD_48]
MVSQLPVPVIIGVGDVRNPSKKLEDALEPSEMMLKAFQEALRDTGLPANVAKELQASIDSIDVVATWTWPYENLPGLLAEKLGVKPTHTFYSGTGGNSPGKLFDDAARRISLGKNKVALVTGGEALASLEAFSRAKQFPPPNWTKPKEQVTKVFKVDSSRLKDDTGAIHSVGLPIQVYPLYENAFRAHRGQSLEANEKESAKLYAEFSRVAEKNPVAWSYGKPAETEQSLATVTKKNRLICYPYPLLMNAFNTVNLSAACIVTTADNARRLGVPESHWVYPLGGAGTCDSSNFWERPNYYSSPSISRSIDSGLESSGLKKEEVDLFDFYSCFPIVPKLAAHHLGLPIVDSPKPVTLLGGLTSFGGAGNNYSLHAITEMTRQLRKKGAAPRHGLVLANGGVVSYQHVVCLSSHPRQDGKVYPAKNPLPDLLTDDKTPTTDAEAEGDAVIETYTVEYNRDGTPLRAYIVGRLTSNGHRFISNHADESTLKQLSNASKEPIGRSGYVRKDTEKKGRNLFSLEQSGRL